MNPTIVAAYSLSLKTEPQDIENETHSYEQSTYCRNVPSRIDDLHVTNLQLMMENEKLKNELEKMTKQYQLAKQEIDAAKNQLIKMLINLE
jgi:hypothetical protein